MKKWRFFAILAGYYLRREILQEKTCVQNEHLKIIGRKQIDDKVGWVAEAHPTLPE